MNFRDSLNDAKYNTSQDKRQKTVKNENINEEFLKNVNKYKDFSHDDLMNEFIKKTMDLKRNGQLSKERVEEIYNTLEPVLNSEQKKNLRDLLKMI